MAKSALLDVLQKTIGKYVLNLDAESLNVAVWSGTIELNALELNVAAVNAELDRQAAEAPNLALPFRVLNGKFERFQVDVSWAHLTSKPLVLRARGLTIELEPYDRASSVDFLYSFSESESIRAKKIADHRILSIQLADEYRRDANLVRKLAEQEVSSTATATKNKEGKDSFAARLVRKIIENMQIEICNVKVAINGAEGMAGVTLQSLQLVTTDSRGTRTFVDRSTATTVAEKEFLYKFFEIKGLGAYLNEQSSRRVPGNLPSIREDGTSNSSVLEQTYSFVLSPLSFEAKLCQADSNDCVKFPKYLLESKMSDLSLSLSKTQLEVWQKIMAQIRPTLDARRPLFPEYRPSTRIKSGLAAREWWKYACRCIGRLTGRRLWSEFFHAFRKRKRYILLYKCHMHSDRCGWIDRLTAYETNELIELENDRSISVEGLMTWRNIADAQAEKEQEKNNERILALAPKTGFFTSLFGSSVMSSDVSTAVDNLSVSLTAEELQELETVTMEQITNTALSSDSRLAVVNFFLESMDVRLSSYEASREIVLLEMGTVSSSFDINADGAFKFNFILNSLEILDRSTPCTRYPSILKNQNRHGFVDFRREAFSLNIEKTKSGDQHLQIWLNTFEAVASPGLLKELKRFIMISSVSHSSKATTLNPILAQSLSGSVDLFYDANQGTVPTRIFLGSSELPSLSEPQGHDLSSALIEAWKVKTDTRAAWVVDFDIHAPVIILPENCVDARANVIVFDLGRFRLQYGRTENDQNIKQWFGKHPHDPYIDPPALDCGLLSISNMTVVVGKSIYWERLVQKFESLNTPVISETALFEPLSLSIEFGVEMSKSRSMPRVCLLGSIPLISFKISPSQLSRSKHVINSWLNVLKDFNYIDGVQGPTEHFDIHLDVQSKSSTGSKGLNLLAEARRGSSFLASHETVISVPTVLLYLEFRLQRLSVCVASGDGGGMESHLVSVKASFSSLSDSSTSGNLSMGWFWVLDRLKSELPRQQRFFIHSRLPNYSKYVLDGEYDVVEDLRVQGVFEQGYAGSTELADVLFIDHGTKSRERSESRSDTPDITIDATFTSLRVNWNPSAVKTMLATARLYLTMLDDNISSEVGSIILTSPNQLKLCRSFPDEVQLDQETNNSFTMKVTAVMGKFEISLNSARDDLPIFHLSMSTAVMSMTYAAEDTHLDLSLDDICLETPQTSRTDPLYRTVLGVAPDHPDSLFKVEYFAGNRALSKLDGVAFEPKDLDTYARIVISPMRLVYIHAQILALVEFSTEGILGTIAMQAATSAVAAAKEITVATSDKKKMFVIEATGLQAVMPQAASSLTYITVTTGIAAIEYTSFPDPGGGQSTARLSDLFLSDSTGSNMLEQPIQTSINMLLPPDHVGSEDDQAMRINIKVSDAPFILTKTQYGQILQTLDTNIGETDLCVRNKVEDHGHIKDDALLGEHLELLGLTHSGVTVEETLRIMCVNVTSSSLSFVLCNEDPDDPIIRLAAVDASISTMLIPSEGRMTTNITLSDLWCTDDRIKALGRQHRTLIYQEASLRNVGDSKDVFTIGYESRPDSTTSVELRIGSPRIVFIPDAVSEIVSFLDIDRSHNTSSKISCHQVADTSDKNTYVVETSSFRDDQVEAHFVEKQPALITSMDINVVTSSCCFILVDLGCNSLRQPGVRKSKIAALSETIVFGGVFESRFRSVTDQRNGTFASLDLEMYGSNLEVFTAYGSSMEHPMQILEPTQLTFHVSVNNSERKDRSIIDLRAAILTPVDWTFSMRNLALMNAILSSVSECFYEQAEKSENVILQSPLNESQILEIEHLARSLENSDNTNSRANELIPTSFMTDTSGEISKFTVSIKITIPEAKCTVINDLQGLDEPLSRIFIHSAMVSGHMHEGIEMADGLRTYTSFDFKAHSSLLADFFDETEHLWRPLLQRPWEINTKAARSESLRYKSPRPSTAIEIECFSCALSFSEQFLMSIASANRTWSVYSTATSSALDTKVGFGSKNRDSVSASLAASAARTLTTSLPYAIENHTGVDIGLLVHGTDAVELACNTGTMVYFRFDPPKGSGSGGKRVYGQDLSYAKSVTLIIHGSCLKLENVDTLVGFPRCVHDLGGFFIVISVFKEEKTIVVHLSSGFDICNKSSVPISVGASDGEGFQDLGRCMCQSRKQSIVVNGGKASKLSPSFGVPVKLMKAYWDTWKKHGHCSFQLQLCPESSGLPDGWTLHGLFDVNVGDTRFQNKNIVADEFDVTCRPFSELAIESSARELKFDAFVLRVKITIEVISDLYPVVDMTMEPRAILENGLPVALSIRSPMPHTFSIVQLKEEGKESMHWLGSGDVMEVFTPGPSIAVSIKCADSPVAGSPTGWMHGWVDLPLVPQFRFPEAIKCEFPLVRGASDTHAFSGAKGSEFFIADGASIFIDPSDETTGRQATLPETYKGHRAIDAIEVADLPDPESDLWRAFVVTVYNYGVDHTGDLLFEHVESPNRSLRRTSVTNPHNVRSSMQRQVSPPCGAFASSKHSGRVSLLPGLRAFIRLLHLTMEGDEGIRRSKPFRLDDVAICDGGVDSTPLLWEDGYPSGFFAYRTLVSSYQSEVHVIPEFVVFNGSTTHEVRIKQPGGHEMIADPGRIVPLRTNAHETATISVIFENLEVRTSPLRVDTLGLRIAVVKNSDGSPVGSLALQTVVGSNDSRLVVKMGELKLGALRTSDKVKDVSWFAKDFFRFRIQLTELQVSLFEGRPITESNQAFFETAMDRIRKAASRSGSERGFNDMPRASNETWIEARKRYSDGLDVRREADSNTVCTIIFSRCTIDWQRVFKDTEPSGQLTARNALRSPERSQLFVIVHHVQMRDEMPNSPYPIVLDSTSDTSFFDLCIRCRGPLNNELVKVDLFDLNLAHSDGVSQKIHISTSEDFVWRLLDLANRIVAAAGALAGVDMVLTWDEEQEGYTVAFRDKTYLNKATLKYTPPSSDRLFDIARARVSPFTMVLSFMRNPQSTRYKVANGKGSNLMNYFTKRLKFKVDRAELKFARYDSINIKGPPDRLIEILSTVYMSRAKLKLMTIMTATSFQDWKSLTARDEGDDDFVEGDVLRATGNIAGNMANYIFKHAGRGLGQGVSNVTSNLGNKIENATDAIGARAVGAGVNSIVTGVGDGVSSTISGVGSGAGKVFLGAGQGVGAVFGGLTGGALLIGKGVSTAIATGDGRAAVSGVSDGVSSLGAGVGQGFGSVVSGTREGAVSVGQGLFTGVKSVGKGIGGAFRDCCSCCIGSDSDTPARGGPLALASPLLPD